MVNKIRLGWLLTRFFPGCLVAVLLLVARPSQAQMIFVANSGNNTVTEYNSLNGALVQTISTGVSSPDALALSTDYSRLYVANTGNNTVTAYNTSTGALIGTTSSGVNDPTALATLGDSLYVANFGGGSGTVIASGTTISTGINGPSSVAILGNVNFPEFADTVVANRTGSSVTEYYQGGGESYVGAFTSGVSAPTALLFDGFYLWVANGGNNTLTKYYNTLQNGANDPLLTVSTGVNGPGSLVEGSSALYVANTGNNTVTNYNPATGTLQQTISSGVSDPSALAVWGTNLFVANESGNSVTEYNGPSGGAPLTTITSGVDAPTAMVITPEPGSCLLLGGGLAFLVGRRTRKK